jgi:glycosyltransferase involved in cell wall biosynthesis
MKVLYRIPYPYFFSQHDSVGGHIAHSLGIIGGLVGEGHSVTVLAHEGREVFGEAGADFVKVEGNGSGMLWRQFWLWRFFRRSNELMNGDTFDFSYTRYSASATPHLWATLRRETTPNVVEINTLGAQRLGLLKGLDSHIIRLASVPIVISGALKEWIRENMDSGVASQVQVVANGVGSERFRPLREESHEGTFRLAFAGLLKPHYGLECVIDAAKRLSGDDISFHIYGAGPAKSKLEDLSGDVGNFVLEGEVPFRSVPDRLSEMDGVLYTTSPHYAYQSPTKLFEYMAVGRPIVAARTPQTEDILEEGKLGRLFEMESAESLVNAVRDVRNNYDTALDRARKAQQVAREKHSWQSRVRRIVDEVTG